MRAYEAVAPSGDPWLGDLPAHWEIKPLDRICNVFPSNVDKKACDDELPVKLCNYVDVYYNDVVHDGLAFMEATASPEQIEKFTLRAGDTIITKDSETADDIGIAALVPKDMPGVVCGYHLSMLRPRPGTHGAFVKRLFDSRYVKSCLAVRANGLTRVGLSQYALDSLMVPFPPHEEQVAIAEFLDRETAKIDALVAEQRRLIELLKEKRQAVISHAVTKGLNHNAPMKPSGIDWLGDVPAHWELTKLSKLTTKIGDGLHGTPVYVDDSPFKFINGNNLSEGKIVLTDSTRSVGPDQYQAHLVPLNHSTLLLSINGTIGNYGLYQGETVILGKSAAYINCAASLHRKFLALYLQCWQAKRYFAAASTGTTISNLSLGAIRDLIVPLPPVEEQLQLISTIGQIVLNLSNLEAEAERSLDLLSERRSSLISSAVTGKVDVLELLHVVPT